MEYGRRRTVEAGYDSLGVVMAEAQAACRRILRIAGANPPYQGHARRPCPVPGRHPVPDRPGRVARPGDALSASIRDTNDR